MLRFVYAVWNTHGLPRTRIAHQLRINVKYAVQHLLVKDLLGRAAVEQLPAAHSHKTVCEARRLIQLVEHHDDRLAVRLVEVLYETQHLHLMCHIEKARGLIAIHARWR